MQCPWPRASFSSRRSRLRKSHELQRCSLPRPLLREALLACMVWLFASSGAMADAACKEKQGYNSVENKVHLAVCRGVDITLTQNESVTAEFLTREITDQDYLDKLKGRGFSMTGGTVLGKFDLRDRHFDVPSFRISSFFDDVVDLTQSQFGGSVSLRGSTLRKGLLASRVVVGGSLLLGDSDDAQFIAASEPKGSPIMFIKAPHARVSGDVIISGATINKEIDISNSQIAGSLTVMYVTAERIDFSASDLGNQLIFFDCSVNANNGKHDMNLYSIRTKQSVLIDRVTAQNDIYLEGAEIDGDLVLLGTHLSSMNARSSNVSGSFVVGLNEYGHAPPMWTTWTNKSELDLTNARLGGFRGPEQLDLWPKSIWFHNLSFKSFSADFCGAPSCQHNSSWYGQWLSTQAGERKSFEPYKEVIDLLMAQGEVLEALDLGVLGHDVEREDAYRHGEFIRHILLSVYRYTVGYGYKLYWVVYSILFFVIVGAVIFRQTPEARRRHMPFGLFYSFDMLLPIIRLRDSHYKIDLKGDARYYFYFHKLVGWALGATLIAALSGIAK
jgi:hypothetical protein